MQTRLRIKDYFHTIFLHVLLYLFIYSPYVNVFGVQAVRLLYPIALIIFILHYRSFYKMFAVFYKELVFILLWILFSIWHSIGGGSISFLNLSFSVFVDCYILGFSLFILFRKNNADGSLLAFLYRNAIVAALISYLLLLLPDARAFALEQFNLLDESRAFLQYRGFGISSGLTFDYAIVQGFALSFCLLYRHGAIDLIVILLLLASVIFNARIGIIIPLLTMLYLLVFKPKFKYLLALFCLWGLFQCLLQTEFYEQNEMTFSWLEDGFDELMLNISGSSDGTTLGALQDMYVFPTVTIDWLLGKGVNVYSSVTDRSDIGYCIQIMYGGILYMSIIAGWLLCVLSNSNRYISISCQRILLFMAISLLFFNYKGSVFSSNCVIRLFILLSIFWRMRSVFSSRQEIIRK